MHDHHEQYTAQLRPSIGYSAGAVIWDKLPTRKRGSDKSDTAITAAKDVEWDYSSSMIHGTFAIAWGRMQ